MVNTTSPCHRGYNDWFIQRITALLIGIYAIFLIVFLLIHHPISYLKWHELFSYRIMKIITTIVICSILWHSWIGMWIIFTDYIKNKFLRLALETIVFLLLVGYFVWTIEFLWIAC